MILRFLEIVFAIVLPFLIYGVYRFIQRRRGRVGKNPWPVTVLFLVGAFLAAQTIVLAALTDKRLPDSPDKGFVRGPD
jgi:predicted PurR-regulated permease PerM